jgi:polar amino acid transport system substrate-binding protein
VKRLRWTIVGTLLVLIANLGGAQEEPVRPRALRIAIEEYPPYEYVENGEFKGINIEIFKRIFKRLNIPYELNAYPFSRGWIMLSRGAADASPSISYNKKREHLLYYTDEQRAFAATGECPTDYLWLTEYVFFINKKFENSLHFESYDQMRQDGYRVGIQKSYSYHPGFLEHPFKFKQYPSTKSAFKALDRGEIDVFPMDKTVGERLKHDAGLANRITTLPKSMFTKPYLMAFSKASDYPDIEGVMKRFYAELRKMRESGEYGAIKNAHMQPQPPAIQPSRPLLFVCENWAPFEYEEDGIPKGIDVDITKHIMDTLGLPYEIHIYPWSRAWMMANNGKADAVLSISYKAAREDVLIYTQEQREFGATGKVPSDYLWMSDYVFFVKTKFADTYTYESYDQLRNAGYRIGKNRDYSYDTAFNAARLPGKQFHDTKSGLEALLDETIELYPMDKTVGLATLKEMGLLASVTYLPKPLFSKPYLVTFVRKSDYPNIESIMLRFNYELRAMRSGGDIERIRKKYLDHTE